MVRILNMLPGIDGGGIGEIVYTYSKYMDKRQFCCDVVALETIDGHQPFLYDEMSSVVNKLFLVDRHHYFHRFIQFCRVLGEGHYDIIHCHMNEKSVVYLFIAWLYGVKVRIAHSHIATGDSGHINSCLKLLLPFVTTHKYGCGVKAFESLWGNTDRMHVMTNAIELQKFQYDELIDKKQREIWGIDQKTTVIGTVGRMTPQKNPFFIVEIIRSLSDVYDDFMFFWIGTGELADAVKQKVRERGIQDKVVFLGLRNDVPELFSVLNLFILPSLYEGLPIVGVEAQAAGLPCLFADTITPEIGLVSSTRFVPIDSPDVWASEIVKMAGQRPQRTLSKEMENSAYNIEVAVRQLEKEYNTFEKTVS